MDEAISDTPVEAGVALTSLLLFIVFIPFAFSEEFTNGVLDASQSSIEDPRWLYLCVDLVILIVLASLATALRARRHKNKSWRVFAAWMFVGAAGTLAVDWIAAGDSSGDYQNLPRLGMYLLADAAWLIFLAVFVAAALDLNPTVMFRGRPQEDWETFRVLLPLILGTAAAWIAGQLWDYALPNPPPASTASSDVKSDGLVGAQFFPQLSQVIPLLLVALAVEARVFRRALHHRSQRAASIVTVAVLCLGELAVLSVLASRQVQNSLDGWHEFIAFVLGIEAVLVGLITLVLVATEAPAPPPVPSPPPAAAPEPPLGIHSTTGRTACGANWAKTAGMGAVLALAYGLGRRRGGGEPPQ